MGKNKVRKPKTLQRQFLITYLMIMICSLITAAFLITVFYITFHSFHKEDRLDLNSPKLTSIIEYIHEYGNSIEEDYVRQQLDALARSNDVDYYIQDKNQNILFQSNMIENESQKNLLSHLSDTRHNLRNTSHVQIPIFDDETGQMKYMLVITNYSTMTWIALTCVDAGIPFICFLAYTYIFARRFSKRIRVPLKELMTAAEKIKNKDVEFSITCIKQENEIGDLILAFEDMRYELKNSLMKQWQLEKDRRDMVASITHDIRTPLAIIQGHIEGLQEGLKYDPQKLNSYLSVIELNISRTKKLIDDMNTLVEIDNDGFSLYPSPIKLQDYMEDKKNEIEILANKKEIQIDSKIIDCRKEKTLVCLDTSRLSQIIDNIVSNSIRYTPNGGNIRIYTEIRQDEALFRIWDNGAGFSEKDLTNLFKKFYKGDSSRSIEKGHSGLGLYISKSIVEKHGGMIKAFNLSEGGACIEFCIKFENP